MKFLPFLSVFTCFFAYSSTGFNFSRLPSLTTFSPVPSIGIYTTGTSAKLTFFNRPHYYLADMVDNEYIPYPVCKDSIKQSHPSFFSEGQFVVHSDGRCLHILSYTSKRK